jgi:hypothetical protein
MSYTVWYEWKGEDLHGEEVDFSSIIKFPSVYMFDKSEKIRKNLIRTGAMFDFDKFMGKLVEQGILFKSVDISACVDLHELD